MPAPEKPFPMRKPRYRQAMSKKRIRDIRHEELIDAAIQAIAEHGYAQVTMTDIAKQAGSTAASINYYFGSKDQLIQAVMQLVLRTLKAANLRRLKMAETPYDRLMAGLDANFDETLFTSATCSIWLQFWANAPYHEGLARLQRVNRMRVTSHFRAELRQLLPENRMATVQQALQNYIDGVWIEAAMNPGPVNAKAARLEARRVADLLLKGG